MDGNQGLLRNICQDNEIPEKIKRVGQYECAVEESIHEDPCAYNLHDMFDVSVNEVPDIEGTLMCTETLNDESENEDCSVQKQQITKRSQGEYDESSTERQDSGFNSQVSSSPPVEASNRPYSPSGSEADVEDSDSDMDHAMNNVNSDASSERNSDVDDLQYAFNYVHMNADILQARRSQGLRRTTVTRFMHVVSNQDDSVVPSSPTFESSTSRGVNDDAQVPYVASDELVSDGSVSDGDIRRSLHSCRDHDHVVPQSYIEE